MSIDIERLKVDPDYWEEVICKDAVAAQDMGKGQHPCFFSQQGVEIFLETGSESQLIYRPEPSTASESHDPINSPSHYASGGIECIDAMQAMLSRDEFIGYLRGNIFKYQWRYKLKNGVEDLKKAQWYANRLIELEQSK